MEGGESGGKDGAYAALNVRLQRQMFNSHKDVRYIF